MTPAGRRRVCIVTGTRAEFGLLRPVIDAVLARPELEAGIAVAGAHLLPPAHTSREVEQAYPGHIIGRIPMQQPGVTGRLADARALGAGIAAIADNFEQWRPDWVVVLGDRIEAFAAASAASVGGIAVAHIHGGDRAEGVADEAMRHAITKLAHLHLAATEQSARRIVRMGEPEQYVLNVGSPAADGIAGVAAMDDAAFAALGAPTIAVLQHPAGLPADGDRAWAHAIADAMRGERVLWLAPNHDPGREAIVEVMQREAARDGITQCDHLPHAEFRSLIKRLGEGGGVLVGNSSSGLIEAALLRCPAVDCGPRQGGRERPNNVVHVARAAADAVEDGVRAARAIRREAIVHPYGDGRAGTRIAAALAGCDPHAQELLRKRHCD